jgi:hypothetical protein
MLVIEKRTRTVIHNQRDFSNRSLAIAIASPLNISSGAFSVGRKRG